MVILYVVIKIAEEEEFFLANNYNSIRTVYTIDGSL